MPFIQDPEPRHKRPKRDKHLDSINKPDKIGHTILIAVLVVCVLTLLTLWFGFRRPHGDKVCYYDHNSNWTCQRVNSK